MNILELKDILENILSNSGNREKNINCFVNLISTSEELEFIDNDSDWYDLFVDFLEYFLAQFLDRNFTLSITIINCLLLRKNIFYLINILFYCSQCKVPGFIKEPVCIIGT